MKHIKLITDSGSDISKAEAKRMDVEVIPLNLVIDHTNYMDYHDFDNARYSRYLLECETIPTTSQPSPDAFLQAFHKFGSEYDDIIVVTMSVHGSGTYNSACTARDLFEEEGGSCRVHVVDSWSCGLNMVLELNAAHEMIGQGCTCQEILDRLYEIRQQVCTYYLVDNIQFLIKGGRVSVLKGSIAAKLKLKPIVCIREGKGSNQANAMGFQNGVGKLASIFIGDCDENGVLYVSHVDCEDKAMALVSKVRETYPGLRYHVTPMLGVMSTQGGPGTIAMFYQRNK